MVDYNRDLVIAKARQCFPNEDQEKIMGILDLYGKESHERELERVQIAILKLSDGDLENLRAYVKTAKSDFRDVLAYAEFPEEMRKDTWNVLGESKRLKGDYEAELVGQLAYSQAKFVIENPDKAQDDAAVYLAGVEGVLRTWQAIKAAKPKAKFELMEELLQKQQSGTLAEYVRAGMKGCK